jgi:hypothetical protein
VQVGGRAGQQGVYVAGYLPNLPTFNLKLFTFQPSTLNLKPSNLQPQAPKGGGKMIELK